MNLDDFGDTITMTNVIDIVHHATGDTTSPNLLAAPVTLDSYVVVGTNTLEITHTYLVLPGDTTFPDGLLKDDAQAGGIDNHDGSAFQPPSFLKQPFFVTFPGQVFVMNPCLNVTKECVNGVGENGSITFSGSVSNCGNTLLTNVLISDFINGAFVPILGPTNLDVGQVIAVRGSYQPNDPCHPASDTLFAWGTDELGLTVTNSATATCSNVITAAISVAKQCPASPVAPGQLVVFTGSVSNAGNVTLTNVVVVGDQPVPNTPVASFPMLEIGQNLSFTNSYVAPSNVCALPDTLSVGATSICGVMVSGSASAVCAITNTPAIAVTKSCPADAVPPGGTLVFSGSVSNAGNIALTNVVVVNNQPANNTPVTNFARLEIGQMLTFASSHTVPAGYTNCTIADTLTARAIDLCGVQSITNFATAACPILHTLVIACPPNLTLQCLTDVPAPNPNSVTVVTNNAGPVTVTPVGDLIVTNGCSFTITRTYHAVDACTNATCAQIITVHDTLPPVITCPANVTLECAVSPTTNNTGVATATDTCSGVTNLTFVDALGSTNCTGRGMILRTWTATDGCGNRASCVQTIGFTDTVPPVLVGLPTNGFYQCLSDVPTLPAVTATDTCDASPRVTLVSVTNGTCPLYITNTWTARDGCSNSASAIRLIRVWDTIAPVLAGVPGNRTYGCLSDVPPPAIVTATDNCDTNVLVTRTSTTNGFRPTLIVHCWTAMDRCGNPASACQTNTVLDLPAAIGDFVWDDLNQNGLQDAGEPGISNAVVRLLDCSNNLLAVTNTDGSGHYLFTNLVCGSYVVQFVAPGGYTFTPQNVGSNDTIDSDANPSNGMSQCVTLSSGEINRTVDAGLTTSNCPVSCAIGAVSEPTYRPANKPPGRNQAFWMRGITTNLVFSPEPGHWVTNSDGTAQLTGTLRSLTNMSSGFFVTVNFSGLQTTPPPGSPNEELDPSAYIQNGGPIDPSTWYYYTNFTGTLTGFGFWQDALITIKRQDTAFQVGAGANGKNTHFGATGWFAWTVVQQPASGNLPQQQLVANINLDLICCQPATLGDFVWQDLNQNGIQDAGEPGISNVVVRLLDCTNKVVLTNTTTDADGFYQFNDLLPGSYFVQFVATTGYAFTQPYLGGDPALDSDADQTTGLSQCVTLAAGEINNTVDAGLIQTTNCPPSCVIGAFSDPTYRPANKPPGRNQAFWMRGISTNLVFSPDPGHWVENSDGTAQLTGTLRSLTNMSSGFFVTVNLSGRQTTPPSGSPNEELDPSAYIRNGGPIDPSTWYYYTSFAGTLTGFGFWQDALITIKRQDSAFQVGVGANGKNTDFGATGWYAWTVVHQPASGNLPQQQIAANINIDLICCQLPRVVSLVNTSSTGRRMTIQAVLGRSYTIEGSKDMLIWKPITTLPNTNGVLQFTDPAGSARCFYRLIMQP